MGHSVLITLSAVGKLYHFGSVLITLSGTQALLSMSLRHKQSLSLFRLRTTMEE